MNPTIALLLLVVLVAALTVFRRNRLLSSKSALTSLTSASSRPLASTLGFRLLALHLFHSLVLALLVWLLNVLLWSGWPERGEALVLLGLEAGLLGGFTAPLLHIPAYQKGRKSQATRKAIEREEESGVIRLRKFGQTRGVLRPGVAVVWNERRGGWSTPEAALEDERNAIAG